jgi:uncharacterized sulfatase
MQDSNKTMTRRAFGAGLASTKMLSAAAEERPNILWITCEDTGPQLGCYGDKYAHTPNLDGLAAKGMIYRHAWSNAPVCAPARTTIISGMYPPSTGSEHMRSLTHLPEKMRMYPWYLREAGYYATNNSKEDYNLAHTGKVWDESSNKAHWRNRRDGQPFFAVFNFTTTHESQVRKRPHKAVHDPAMVRVPAYHPDTPEVRQDWAQYYDNITTMDGQAAEILNQLEQDGLAANTIVFFYGDHGPGMPRSKRWPYNSGLQVPLIVYIPEKFKHLAPKDYKRGGSSQRLVSFVDLAPTVLSLAGIKPPPHMQGECFMGRFNAPERQYVYGFRGRMDERYDLVRSVRDKRYVYIRNYMPHKIYGQYISYMFETPTTRVWKKHYDSGLASPAQARFWETKPPEELYDLHNDPDEVNNLAGSLEHAPILKRMREAQRELALRIRDVGFLPEAEIHSRSKGSTPFEMGHDEKLYPMKRVFAAAELASSGPAKAYSDLVQAMTDEDSGVRYWGATGVLIRGATAVNATRVQLEKCLHDPAPSVRVVAAEALGRYGSPEDVENALPVLMDLAAPDKNGVYVSMAALNAIGSLGSKAASVKPALGKLPATDLKADKRADGYVARLLEALK